MESNEEKIAVTVTAQDCEELMKAIGRTIADEAKAVELTTSYLTVKQLCKTYNEAMQGGHIEDAVKADSRMSEMINEFTGSVRDLVFAECKASDDPMLHAVTILTFMTIAVKDEKKGDDKIPVRSIQFKEKEIDLAKLDKYCGGIGADPNWQHIAQKMNFLLTAQKALDLGIDPKAVNDSYEMSAIAAQFDMGKNPTSKTNLLKTLQTVVTAMLGDSYKVTSHDVNFLLSVYSKKGRKALTVSCANHRNFRSYIANICHRVVLDKVYELEFKTKKES